MIGTRTLSRGQEGTRCAVSDLSVGGGGGTALDDALSHDPVLILRIPIT
jgi:hypothetical protein